MYYLLTVTITITITLNSQSSIAITITIAVKKSNHYYYYYYYYNILPRVCDKWWTTFYYQSTQRLKKRKLKQVIDRRSTLEEFISKFFVILVALRTERDHKAGDQFQKVKVHPFSSDSPEGQYYKLLTSYASPFVLKQMELSKKVMEIKKIDDQYFIQTSEGEKCVGSSDRL